jgi:hypothetical protein
VKLAPLKCRTSAVAAVLGLAAGCSKGEGASFLPALDLQAATAGFDANEILDSASMQDAAALDGPGIEAFLQQTPYGGASFLASYVSDGVAASDAIAAAASSYHVDPIVLLVHAEMDQGLVASSGYPSPASRVEFAFGCGCVAPGACDPSYQGFDKQVTCLAAALRDRLDAIAATGTTPNGWGPGVTATTLDGVEVTPADDSTAALYDYAPVVAQGQAGGNWLFWNVWHGFAAALGYTPPGSPTSAASWVGAACTGSGTCAYAGTAGTCATQFPGGLCTLACTASCPSSPSQVATFCADFASQGGFCLAVCNPTDPQCRSGYTCKSVAQHGASGTTQNVCFP